MKFKYIMLISLILLAILTIGSVCATEDIETDNPYFGDDGTYNPIGEGDDDDTYDPTDESGDDDTYNPTDESDGNDTYDPVDEGSGDQAPSDIVNDEHPIPNFYMEYSENVLVQNDAPLYIFNEIDASGDVCILIDGKEKFKGFLTDYDDEMGIYYLKFNDFNLNYGNHTIEARYLGDDYYSPVTVYGNFTYGIIEVDETAMDGTIEIELPEDASGTVTLYIGDRQIQGTVSDGFVDIDVNSLPYGEYSYSYVYSGDRKYPKFTGAGVFEIEYVFEVEGLDDDVVEVIYGDPLKATVRLPYDASGYLEVTCNDTTYKFKASEQFDVEINDLMPGRYEVTFTYADSKYYEKSYYYDVDVMTVIKAPEVISYTDSPVYSLTLPGEPEGTLVVSVDGVQYNASFVGDTAMVQLPSLDMGSHQISVEYVGDDYSIRPTVESVTVGANVEVPTKINHEDDEYLEFNLPSDADGTLELNIAGEIIKLDVVDGQAKYPLSNLDAGQYDIIVSYKGDSKYPEFNNGFFVDIKPVTATFTVSAPSEVIAGTATEITVYGPDDCEGDITIYVNGVAYTSYFEGGMAVVEIIAPAAGIQTLDYSFTPATDNYYKSTGGFKVNVQKAPKIKASNFKMLYYDGSKYKVKIMDANGKAVGKGQKVVFYINDKKLKTVKTDKKGYAYVKITKVPGTYKIKTVYKGVSVTKKLKVKKVLTLKKVNVKKSAKKLTLTATLNKVKGKYLKGKKITFKFNGKKYKVKTNKKGVAKLTIDKSVLLKLKAGKKIKYQATYIKSTVKYTVKVAK